MLLVLNICVFVLFLIQATTGGIIWYGDLTNSDESSSNAQADEPPHPTLEKFHPINGTILTIFIILHLYMNRKWISTQLLHKQLIKQ